MSNTYEYKITDLQRNEDGIVTAAFTITASDGTDSFTHNYHTGFAAPKSTPIPYEEVSESQVIEWIMSMYDTKDDDGVRQNSYEDQADAELKAFKSRNHKIKNGMPWDL
jgi:hypothetical protein